MQILFEHTTRLHERVHCRFEEAETAFAVGLRAIKREVGALEQGVGADHAVVG